MLFVFLHFPVASMESSHWQMEWSEQGRENGEISGTGSKFLQSSYALMSLGLFQNVRVCVCVCERERNIIGLCDHVCVELISSKIHITPKVRMLPTRNWQNWLLSMIQSTKPASVPHTLLHAQQPQLCSLWAWDWLPDCHKTSWHHRYMYTCIANPWNIDDKTNVFAICLQLLW